MWAANNSHNRGSALEYSAGNSYRLLGFVSGKAKNVRSNQLHPLTGPRCRVIRLARVLLKDVAHKTGVYLVQRLAQSVSVLPAWSRLVFVSRTHLPRLGDTSPRSPAGLFAYPESIGLNHPIASHHQPPPSNDKDLPGEPYDVVSELWPTSRRCFLRYWIMRQ